MEYNPLLSFTESYSNHQKLVDTILEFKDEDGICRISQPELARLLNKSQTWVCSAIKQINTEDTCIEMVGTGKYVIHYNDLLSKGVFSEIATLIETFLENPEILNIQDLKIAEAGNIKLKTVQMFKAYFRSGRKQFAKEHPGVIDSQDDNNEPVLP